MLLEIIIHTNVSKLIYKHGFIVGTCQCNAEKDLECFFILRIVVCFPTNIHNGCGNQRQKYINILMFY